MQQNISARGYILAGGKSSRFGRDKSLHEFMGKPLIQHVAERLIPVFPGIVIVSNDADKYRFLNLETIPDIIQDLGPLGGIYSALAHAGGQKIFVTGCDMPWLNADFIRYMLGIPDLYDIIVPIVSGQYEPLHAIYMKNCMEEVKALIDSGKRKITLFYEKLDVRMVTEEEIEYYDDPIKIFQNINYPDDTP